MRFTLLTVATRTAQRLNVLLFFLLFAVSDDQLKFCTAPFWCIFSQMPEALAVLSKSTVLLPHFGHLAHIFRKTGFGITIRFLLKSISGKSDAPSLLSMDGSAYFAFKRASLALSLSLIADKSTVR